MGSKGENIFFSEYGHVTYQIKIKRNETYSKRQAIFCPYTHPWPLGWGQKFFFSESGHVAYQIKGKVGHAYTMVIYTMGGLWGRGFLSW